MFAAGQHEPTDGHHIHAADGFTDDGKRIVADLAIRHEIIWSDQITRINVGLPNELIDVDGPVNSNAMFSSSSLVISM